MDAFYVNVHLLDHGEDAGVPLVVGGQPGARGVVTSASYEARRHGVPIIEQRALARSLWRRRKVGQPVPDALFQGVARILARVYKAKSARTPAGPRR